MSDLTSDAVRAILGPIEDSFVAEILALGATREELAEALAWTIGGDAPIAAGRQHPSGRVAQLVSILNSVEESSPVAAPD